jgi:hypothetical protein
MNRPPGKKQIRWGKVALLALLGYFIVHGIMWTVHVKGLGPGYFRSLYYRYTEGDLIWTFKRLYWKISHPGLRWIKEQRKALNLATHIFESPQPDGAHALERDKKNRIYVMERPCKHVLFPHVRRYKPNGKPDRWFNFLMIRRLSALEPIKQWAYPANRERIQWIQSGKGFHEINRDGDWKFVGKDLPDTPQLPAEISLKGASLTWRTEGREYSIALNHLLQPGERTFDAEVTPLGKMSVLVFPQVGNFSNRWGTHYRSAFGWCGQDIISWRANGIIRVWRTSGGLRAQRIAVSTGSGRTAVFHPTLVALSLESDEAVFKIFGVKALPPGYNFLSGPPTYHLLQAPSQENPEPLFSPLGLETDDSVITAEFFRGEDSVFAMALCSPYYILTRVLDNYNPRSCRGPLRPFKFKLYSWSKGRLITYNTVSFPNGPPPPGIFLDEKTFVYLDQETRNGSPLKFVRLTNSELKEKRLRTAKVSS